MAPSDKDLWAMAAENLSWSDRLPELDLHGLALYEAVPKLESFLNMQFMQGQEAVKIICGIGTGKLMAEVKKQLLEYRRYGLVENFTQPASGGVFIVRLNEK